MIGFPIGIDERNRDRRALLRELWYPEYDNIGKTVRVEFVIGLLTYQGDGHEVRGARSGLNALAGRCSATGSPSLDRRWALSNTTYYVAGR